MSGRRSNNAEGRPGGIVGSVGTAETTAIVSSAGGLPISTAIACSNWARKMPVAIACARVFSSWVRACATSEAETMPASYWFCVIRNDSL